MPKNEASVVENVYLTALHVKQVEVNTRPKCGSLQPCCQTGLRFLMKAPSAGAEALSHRVLPAAHFTLCVPKIQSILWKVHCMALK